MPIAMPIAMPKSVKSQRFCPTHPRHLPDDSGRAVVQTPHSARPNLRYRTTDELPGINRIESLGCANNTLPYKETKWDTPKYVKVSQCQSMWLWRSVHSVVALFWFGMPPSAICSKNIQRGLRVIKKIWILQTWCCSLVSPDPDLFKLFKAR